MQTKKTQFKLVELLPIARLIVLSLLVASIVLSGPAWAAIGIDASSSVDQAPAKPTVTTPAFSTASSNELLPP